MNLVTTIEGVASLTRAILKADASASEGRETFLQSLVLRTQKELGAQPRERSGRGVTLDKDGVKAQIAALNTAHDEFHAAVIKAASENLPGTSAKSKELNRRTNFSRTAKYSVAAWIRSGRDVTALAATKVTKGNIAVKRTAVSLTPRRLTNKVAKGVTELIDLVTQLAAHDKAAAVDQLQHALTLVSNSLAALSTTSATRDPAKAIAQHIPLRVRAGLFVPVSGNGGRVAA